MQSLEVLRKLDALSTAVQFAFAKWISMGFLHSFAQSADLRPVLHKCTETDFVWSFPDS
jgi:hypothetical protein